MQPKKGKYGLWYVDGTGFATEELALKHMHQKAHETQKATSSANIETKSYTQKSGFLGYKKLEWAFSAVAGIAFLSFLFWWNSAPTADELAKRAEQQALSAEQRAEKDCKSKTMHHVMSDQLIREGLKSPSTAKFSSYPNTKTEYLGNCRVKHIGYVDAQNSLGAVIRRRYESITVYSKASKKYQLESLDI